MEGRKGINHQSMVDLMTAGSIGRLLPKLGEFLKQEHNLQTTMKENIESLEIHLRRMDTALGKMPRAQQDQLDPQDDKHCAYELRDLSYDIEDIVDNLLLSVDDGSEPIANNQDTFKETLEDIKIRVKNLDAWRAGFVAKPTTRSVDPSLEDGFMQVRQLVDIHKLQADLITRMSSSSSQRLKIVSIWGAGGMGKTTLAKEVYENIRGDFDCSAFVSVGQQADVKKALRGILTHLGKKRNNVLINMTMLNEGELIDELQHFLENKRFLIVIDDIRDIPSWEVIKCALVDNGCGSRLVTTSRVLNATESSSEVLELMPLSIDGSKELFYATLCYAKGAINFDPLDEQTTEYIVQKCGCVPLAIIMIASLLAVNPKEEWTEVYNSVGFGQEDNMGAENNTRKIIQFSYYDLPSHLKTCLLYLSIFPDGHVIEKDTLVWRWVAEGFVHDDQEHGESVFKVGERYLYELVSRGMILAIENEDTNMWVCGVEGMVLDWIRTVAKEENFVNASVDWYDEDQHQSNNARIIAIHNRVLDNPHVPARIWKPKVRSFNGTDCSISNTTLLHTTFQVLHVLSLEGCKLTADSSDGLKNLIAELLHLRYLNLGLGGMGIQDLPIVIGHLRYLQTLDLTDTDIGRALPPSVTQLRHLKCLRLFAPEGLVLPPGMGNLTSLEELRLGRVRRLKEFGDELSKLIELRVFHIDTRYIFGETRKETALVQSLSKLQKIEVLHLHMSGGMQVHYLGRGSFPKLRFMKMNTWLVSQPGAMPRLKSVELDVHVRALKDANFDFHDFRKLSYLRFLEKADVCISCPGAWTEEAEEAEAALRRAVESHPNRPKLILNRVGQCVDDKQGALNGKEVAVKLLHLMSQRLNYEEEFMKEFKNLKRLKHRNIVQLFGYCYETKSICLEHEGRSILADEIYRALCFEYMCNGSLQGHIDDEVHRLDWRTCYKIIKGICTGLKYLHEGLETPMYHLDLKPGNILLDKNMVPKIADFGLSKLVYNNKTQATSSFFGTKRYCPPEYIDQGLVSNKFDIFSLGVVMIEIIAGSEGYRKQAEMPTQEFMEHVQENWGRRLQATKGCASVMHEIRQVKRCTEIGLQCVSADRSKRPNIGDITSMLNRI